MTERILERTIRVGVFLVLVVPLIVATDLFFPYITGKAFVFRTLVEIVFVSWIGLAVLNASYRPRWSPILVALLVFLGVVGIANFFGVNPAQSFWSNFERMEGYITLLHIGAYLLVVASVFKTEKLWNMFWIASLGVSSMLAIGSVFEVIGARGDIRVDATLGNSTYYAVYLLFNLFVALLLAYRVRHQRWLLAVYSAVALLMVFTIYYTGTRGTVLAIIGGAIVTALVILIQGRAHPRVRKYSAIGLLLIVLGGAAFFISRESSFVQGQATLRRIADISLTDTTTQSRLTLWSSIGWEGFKERPVLGWGQDNFIYVFGKYYDPIMYKQEPWFDRAHNIFIDWLIAGGALGLLAYLSLFGAAVWMIMRGSLSVPEKALLVGLFAAYAIHNMFVFDHLVSYIYFATMLGYVHTRSQKSLPLVEEKTAGAEHYGAYALGGVGVAALALVFFINGTGYARASTLIEALREDAQSQSTSLAVLELYEDALGSRTGLGVQEIREQLGQSAIRSMRSVQPNAELIQIALDELVENVAVRPNDTRPLYSLGQFLKHAGGFAEARNIFDRALAINPQRQLMLYSYAETYLAEDNVEGTLEYFERAFRAEEENNEARAYYAAALMRAGRSAEAEALLLEGFGTLAVDNELLVQTYREYKRLSLLIEILENRLVQKKLDARNEANTRVALASYYVDNGQRAEAIEHIEKAMELFPAFVEQGTAMVQAIREGRRVEIR